MAHELHIEDGRASIMYVGREPWHGLGTKLDRPATAAEAIKAAHLDYEVRKIPLHAHENGFGLRVEGKYAVVPANKWNQPTCPIFGIVGEGYRILQNVEAFAWFDSIVGAGAAVYHTAGALGEGERVWILAKLPGHMQVADGDIANKYLLLSNSHDGNSSVQIRFTPVRVVCANTLSQALREGGATIRVTHTRDLKERLVQARRNLRIIDTRYRHIEEDFRQMVRVKVDEARLMAFLKLVFHEPADPEDQGAVERVFKYRKQAAILFENRCRKRFESGRRDIVGGVQRRRRNGRSQAHEAG